jgi:glycerate kinase
MSILVAPDSFKGTFTAAEVAGHIAAGIRTAGTAARELPVADGGEGTFEVLVRGLDARQIRISTVGPWGDPVEAAIGLADDGTGVVELAFASGLNLPSDGDRDPLTASTYGTGVLIAEAAGHGARRIVVAAGGSATTDGGAGAIAAIEERGGLRGAEL